MTTAINGKVALVTGAGGGIGLATAEAFAKAGASVVLADRDEQRVGKAAPSLCAAGYNPIGVTCDVTDTVQLEAMIDPAVSAYGRLDAAFNNAGVNSEAAALLETSDSEFETCDERQLARRAQGSGAIVVMQRPCATTVNCPMAGGGLLFTQPGPWLP
jgi:NAD(P)-dependent dehydrogenase (short-subunit alcohol dehydrogenase family)